MRILEASLRREPGLKMRRYWKRRASLMTVREKVKVTLPT